MLRLVLFLALALIVAGCGGETGSSRKPASASAQLTITVWPQGKSGSAHSTYTLACPSGRGTLPGAHSACRKLSRLDASAFAPVPTGTACTEIYGGPQIARVTGTFADEAIDATFSRNNGCEIARWQRLDFLFRFGLEPI